MTPFNKLKIESKLYPNTAWHKRLVLWFARKWYSFVRRKEHKTIDRIYDDLLVSPAKDQPQYPENTIVAKHYSTTGKIIDYDSSPKLPPIANS